MERELYDRLIEREANRWSEPSVDPANPQIWDDPELFEIFFGREYRHLLRRVQEHGPRILELGCGRGGLALDLAGRGLTVTGIDLSRRLIAEATAEALRRNVAGRTRFYAGDLNLIPLGEATFECIVAHDALHHVLEIGSLLDRVCRALVSGGYLIVMDYVGMGTLRKIVAAGMFALLPTYKSYRAKWGLRQRLGSFLATESARRRGLDDASAETLHPDSPFEEISGKSIPVEIRARFRVEEEFTYCPFWYYIDPKLRLPGRWRIPAARLLHDLDGIMLRVRPTSGAHIFMMARND